MSDDATGPAGERTPPEQDPPGDSEPATPSAAPGYAGYDDTTEQVTAPGADPDTAADAAG